MKDKPQKPKPIKRDEYRRLPITRVPYSEPPTPGLRRKELSSAFGFRYDPPDEEE
jgi:hypothetical protein